MTAPTVEQRKTGESIDRLIATDGAGRGVIDELYPAARALQDGPLCLEAAARLLDRVHRGDTVVLATGFPMAPWFVGEQDGPVGTARLARALMLALAARPLIVTDPVNVVTLFHGRRLFRLRTPLQGFIEADAVRRNFLRSAR